MTLRSETLPPLPTAGLPAAAPPPRLRPPAPEPVAADLPWYRLIASFRTNALPSWTHRAYEEPIVPRRVLGRTSLLISAPEAIRDVLVDRHERFGRTPAGIRILRPVVGNGLLLSDGEAWRHQRRTLAPAFTPRAVDLLVPHILASVRETIADLRARSRRGEEPVDLLAAMQFLALDVAGRTMFSLEMDRHGPALRAMFQQYNRNLGRPRLLDFLMPIGIPNPYDLARRRFQAKWMGLIERIMTDRRKTSDGGAAAGARDLFDLMLAARDPETGAAFAPTQLRDQVATMILAGHETTAVAMFWSLYLLALAPEWQERIAEEAAASSDDPAAASLVQTRAVVDEAMRLYPPAFAIVRSAREDGAIGGWPIRRGDTIVIAPWVLHRHRMLWRDPAVFDPTRFLPGAATPVDRFAYLPFGVGPRVCIGAHFALTEATLALAALVRTFRIELANPARPVLPVAVVTTQPDHPPPFRLYPR
jgi:cytochrome P450